MCIAFVGDEYNIGAVRGKTEKEVNEKSRVVNEEVINFAEDDDNYLFAKMKERVSSNILRQTYFAYVHPELAGHLGRLTA